MACPGLTIPCVARTHRPGLEPWPPLLQRPPSSLHSWDPEAPGSGWGPGDSLSLGHSEKDQVTEVTANHLLRIHSDFQ